MKKSVFYFFVLFLLFHLQVYGQYPPCILLMEDYMEPGDTAKTNFIPRYGMDFTPKGVIKIPIIFAGFYCGGTTDQGPISIWPSIDTATGLHTTVPNYALDSTSLMQIIFQTEAQLYNPLYANIKNLTRFYYEMSNGKLIVLGDVFKDPDTSSSTFGQPMRINITPSLNWTTNNSRVLQKIRDTYGAYWNEIWTPFDLRVEVPAYSTDSVYATPDSIVDFAIIHYRYSASWDSLNQPVWGLQNVDGSNGGIAGLLTSLTYSDYKIGSKGFTATGGGLSPSEVVEFYPHELAHRIYNAPHYMGANSTIGNKFKGPVAGWGMMSGNVKSMMCANAFERWLLGWIDIECNSTPTDFAQQSDLNATGEYTLRDFLNYDDCIRIKIPNTTDRYLWIEFHKKEHLFDYKSWTGINPSSGAGRTELVPDFEPGVYMYIEHLAADRDNATYSATDLSSVNRFLPLNAQGNWDYVYSDLPKVVTYNSEQCLNTGYYWNNPTYTFKRAADNPISGTNPWLGYHDDFIKYADTDGDGYKQFVSDKNGTISRYDLNFNSCKNCESVSIHSESLYSDFSNDILPYGNTHGLNTQAIINLGRRPDSFKEFDELSLSGIMPVLNYPDYIIPSDRIDNYVLNGLNIKILENDINGNTRIKISFIDFTVDTNKRWCGYINLVDNTADSQPDLIVDTAVTLTIDKSGTPNRLTLLDGQFINYTVFTCMQNAKFLQEINSSVIVNNNSGLVLNTDATYEINDNSNLIVRNGSTLLLKSGSNLIVYGTGKVIVEQGAYLCIESGAIITLNDIASTLDLQSGFIIGTNPVLNLTSSCIDFCNLTFNGSGSISNIDNHITGISTWSDNEYIVNNNLIIDPTSVLNINDANIKFSENGKLTVKPGGKIVINNSTLTDVCGNLWQGIEVQGNKTLSQFPETNQGVIEIINGGTIENALTAIKTYGPNSNYTGGIIRANGAIFKNNYSSIYIAPYHNHLPNGALTGNRSYIQNCSFETNSVLNDPALNPTNFIVLNDVEGIIIKGNTFKNTNPAATELNEKGDGIYAFNSSCTIDGICTSGTIPCSSYQPNTFQGLNYAINVLNSNLLKVVTITNNTFTDNYRGIALRSTNNSVVTSNTFVTHHNKIDRP